MIVYQPKASVNVISIDCAIFTLPVIFSRPVNRLVKNKVHNDLQLERCYVFLRQRFFTLLSMVERRNQFTCAHSWKRC